MAGVDLLFGPLLLGVVLNLLLYGIMSTQMFTYYQRHIGDSAWIRYLMLYILIVETANISVQVDIVYEPLLVQNAVAALFPKLLPGQSILTAIVSAPIQLFTAWRISVITGSFIAPILVALLSLASFGGGLFASILIWMNSEFQQFQNISAEVAVWLALSAACNIAIAIGMSYALYTHRTKIGAFDSLIDRILWFTVESGVITAIAALADLLLFLLFPKTFVNFLIDFPLANMYACAVLAMMSSWERQKLADIERAQPAPQPQVFAQGEKVLPPLPPFTRRKTIYKSTDTLVTSDDGHSTLTYHSHPYDKHERQQVADTEHSQTAQPPHPQSAPNISTTIYGSTKTLVPNSGNSEPEPALASQAHYYDYSGEQVVDTEQAQTAPWWLARSQERRRQRPRPQLPLNNPATVSKSAFKGGLSLPPSQTVINPIPSPAFEFQWYLIMQHTSTEALAITNSGGAELARSVALASQPHYYNYNGQQGVDAKQATQTAPRRLARSQERRQKRPRPQPPVNNPTTVRSSTHHP
ncbi:hypothetical protein FB451DRAFT_1437968 [Mycena latifolia]|nr:hypothetical protein FB451DRAFT_1437968 [Mycena latifolia]